MCAVSQPATKGAGITGGELNNRSKKWDKSSCLFVWQQTKAKCVHTLTAWHTLIYTHSTSSTLPSSLSFRGGQANNISLFVAQPKRQQQKANSIWAVKNLTNIAFECPCPPVCECVHERKGVWAGGVACGRAHNKSIENVNEIDSQHSGFAKTQRCIRLQTSC